MLGVGKALTFPPVRPRVSYSRRWHGSQFVEPVGSATECNPGHHAFPPFDVPNLQALASPREHKMELRFSVVFFLPGSAPTGCSVFNLRNQVPFYGPRFGLAVPIFGLTQFSKLR